MYYTIVGSETNFNFYGTKEEGLQKTLETNKNGRVFGTHISKKSNWETWEEIRFNDLPKSLQKSFEDFDYWINCEN
jgi:hypothetical protein